LRGLSPATPKLRGPCFIRKVATSAARPLAHPRYVVQHLNNYAYSHLAGKEFQKAESLLKKSLKICHMYTDPVLLHSYAEGEAPLTEEGVVWWGSNYISSTLAALAEVAKAQKDYQKALAYYNEIHAMNVKLYTEEQELQPHYSVIDLLCRIGELYYLANDHDACLRTFDQVIELDKKWLGPNAEKSRGSTGTAYRFKGKMEMDKKNFGQAKKYLEKAWAVHRTVYGIQDLRTIRTMEDAGVAHMGGGDYARAKQIIEHVGSSYQNNNLDMEGCERAERLHKEILSHLPAGSGIAQVRPIYRTKGLDFYAVGESPEEREEARQQLRWEKANQDSWKKSHKTTQ